MHSPSARRRPGRFTLKPLACLIAIVCAAGPVRSQPTGEWPGLELTPSPALSERIPADARSQLPTFVEGGSISGRPELETVIEGDAVLRRGDTVIRGNRIEYDQPSDRARAAGDVRINRAGNIFEGPLLEMNVEAFEGFFTDPSYRFIANDAYGKADLIEFLDEHRSVIRNATYTTCLREPGDSWLPEWLLTAQRLELDDEEETGRAYGATVRFFGVPILPVPVLSFPLSEKRKSGVLPPTIALNNKSGLELTLPYYWDIAPNRDLTFTPTLMAQRGVQLGGEFRYLEPGYNGATQADYMPGDRLRERDRWAYSVRHEQDLRLPLAGDSRLGLSLNRVSDDEYWRDFARSPAITSLTQRLLASEGLWAWGRGNFSAFARALQWQTLQDPAAPIVPPYDRMPQVQGRYGNLGLPGGLTAYVETDYTSFRSQRSLTGQPNGQRSYAMTQFARPWQAPGWFVIPRVQFHATHYEFDAPLANGQRTADRTLPTYSLDSGLVFERDTTLFGLPIVQTLEPRAFYVNTPYREQNFLPNYDSALHDFNFATIFTENAFVGHDRISDTNLLTLGVTSRLQDFATGAELARFGYAQRLRYEDQRVVLPGGAPVVDRFSDVLLGAAINWSPRWSTETTVQYNPKTNRSERATIGARYHPSPYRVINAAYRTQRGNSEQLDVGWQWPLEDLWGGRGGPGQGRWYTVGRLNYSMKDNRLVDSIVGLEYDGCCWTGRAVLERLQAGSSGANVRLLFQIELRGLARLGSNALGVLRDNIPRYQLLREQTVAPSRFTRYE